MSHEKTSTSAPISFPLLTPSVLSLSSFPYVSLPICFFWLYLLIYEIGTKDTLFFSGTRSADSLTYCYSSAQLPFASSFAWTWDQPSFKLVLSVRFKNSSAICLPAMRPISTHLCFSSSVFLLVFEVFDPREPEDSHQPLGSWVNAGPTNALLQRLRRTGMQPPSQPGLVWSTLLQ